MRISNLIQKAYTASGCKLEAYADADKEQRRMAEPKQHVVEDVMFA